VVLDTNKILKGHGFVILASTQLELSTCLMFVFQRFLMNPDSLVSKLPYVCGMLEYHKRVFLSVHMNGIHCTQVHNAYCVYTVFKSVFLKFIYLSNFLCVFN
jgi:hypothetical protein